MKNILHRAILLGSLLICTSAFSSYAQNVSTKGKDFWIGFIRNAHEDVVTLHVYISSDFATAGTISIPLVAWSQNFTVSANSTTDIIIPTALAEPDQNQNQINLPMGIHVVTDTIVSVYALNYEQYTADATVIIPTPSLGYDYYVVSNIALNGYGFPSEFSIVSLTDSTIIEITPTAVTTAGNLPGVPFTIVLDAGELYQVQEGYNIDYNGELTGTRVRATDSINCHRFALFAGTQCSDLPSGYFACDQLYDEMVPINKWGKNYYSVPLASRTSDFIRILASVDNTNFTINGGSPITLNAGAWYDYTESAATIFSADQPIAVAQYSPSYSWDFANGDPFMIMINPIEQHLNLITFNAFASNVITNYYLNVVSPTTATGIITLDGSLIGAANFFPFANDPTYSYAQLDITQGNHTLQSDSGFTAEVYGFGLTESFGYGVGSNLNILPLSFDIVYNGDTINYLAFHDTIGCPGYFSVIAHGDISYTSYQWDFGDGTFGSGTTADHNYTSNGSFTLTLSGFAADQCAPDQVSTVIVEGSVHNLFPSFNIAYNGNTALYSNFFDTLICNYTVNFSALADSLAFNYYWNFGNGDTASGQNVTYTFDSAGVYLITLTETGDSCHQGVVHWTIVVAGGNNLNPLFYIVYNGDTTLFSDFNTTIGCHRDFEFIAYYDSAIISWNWNFGDGTTGIGQDVTHTYSSAGDYVVTLSTQVTDACLDSTISRTLHIVDSITVDIPDMPLCYNGTITMQATT
ncbi:MAG TPA: PKD domain-containing protein, partial [Chitinophagales bacterium]|nr:PKD domain-containing protein [Chitinophagales bacterium]